MYWTSAPSIHMNFPAERQANVVCMYVCMYVCVWACVHACMRACVYVYVRACMHVCMYVYVCIFVCVYMYQTYVHAYVCINCITDYDSLFGYELNLTYFLSTGIAQCKDQTVWHCP